MPNADNPLNVFAQAIVKGIRAENKQLSTPHEIILLPRKIGQSTLSHLQDASLMGASVAIGPITRDDVNEISELPFLPLPVVSLNLPEDDVKSPELLMNFSLSLEEEAKQVASMAIQSLAKENKDSLFSLKAHPRLINVSPIPLSKLLRKNPFPSHAFLSQKNC